MMPGRRRCRSVGFPATPIRSPRCAGSRWARCCPYSRSGCRLRFRSSASLCITYAGATDRLAGMMARSRTKPIAGAIGEDSDKASAPATHRPEGFARHAALLRRPPQFVIPTLVIRPPLRGNARCARISLREPEVSCTAPSASRANALRTGHAEAPGPGYARVQPPIDGEQRR